MWWLVFGLGLGILALGLLSTGAWAKDTATRAAALFDDVERGADPAGRQLAGSTTGACPERPGVGQPARRTRPLS